MGRVNIEAGTPLSRKRKKSWRDAIVRHATEALLASVPEPSDFYPIKAPVRVEVSFYLPIPKTRLKGKRKIEPGSPHISKPDIDKLLRATLDPLKECGMLSDDSIVYGVRAQKRWTKPGDECAAILITW